MMQPKIVVLIFIIGVFSFLACDQSRQDNVATSGIKGVIGISLLTMTNPFFVTIGDVIQAEAAKQGYEVILSAGEFDPARQNNQISDFVVKNAVAIIMSPCDSRSIAQAIAEANKAGIPVFTADIACLDPDVSVVSHIATDNLGGGRLAAQAMIDVLHGVGKVAVLDHPEVTSVILRTRGFDQVLEEARKEKGVKVEVVTKLPAYGIKDKGFNVAQDILQAHPDIDAIFATNDPSALGVVAAVEKAGKAGQVKIIGFDGQPEGRQAVKDGKLYADVIQLPHEIGKKTIEAVLSYLNGDEVPPEILIPTQLYLKKDAEQDSTLN